MNNHNCPNCIQTGKPIADAVICLRCVLYKKGLCSPIENDLYRQIGNGYELYYPIGKIIRKVASYLGITTQEVIKVLRERYKIQTGRTTLLKYQKMGLLNQSEKIGRGKSKGVFSYWDDETPLMLYYINIFKHVGFKLSEVKKIHDILQIKNPQELKKYVGGPLSAIAYGGDPTSIEIMKFFMITASFAAAKLRIEVPTNYDSKIIIDENNLDNSRIEITFINESPDKKVVFFKDGTRIENIA